MAVPAYRPYFLFHIRCLHADWPDGPMLDILDRGVLFFIQKKLFFFILIKIFQLHAQNSRNINIVHNDCNNIIIPLLLNILNLKMVIFRCLHHSQHILLMLLALHLSRHDQVSFSSSRQQKVRLLRDPIRRLSKEYSICLIQRTYYSI
jgi:hypothetical protein